MNDSSPIFDILESEKFLFKTQVPGTALIPLQIARRLRLIKSISLWLRHYKTEEKYDFHLPVSKLPARQHSPFGQIQAEWAVLSSW